MLGETIAAIASNKLEPRHHQRIGRRAERKFVDRDNRQRPAADVHAFPETARAEQRHHRAPKTAQQIVTRRIALYEQPAPQQALFVRLAAICARCSMRDGW